MKLSERIEFLKCKLVQRQKDKASGYDKLSDSEKYSILLTKLVILSELSDLAKAYNNIIVSHLLDLPRPESDLNKKQFNVIFKQIFTEGVIIQDRDLAAALIKKFMDPENFGKKGHEEESAKIEQVLLNVGRPHLQFGGGGEPKGEIYYDPSCRAFVRETDSQLAGVDEELGDGSNQ